MPGILPMKVIKVGTNAQSRIAQACDRCRSKKIRCDGVRPCCSQCSNVGFECKTSDKLSRRAFPRGYTESLEERVRGLELEVRELKDLLDEKDEKIDMLSRIHSQSPRPIQPSLRQQSVASIDSSQRTLDTSPKDDTFKVQQSPYLLEDGGTNSYFSGTSSGRTFIEAFKSKIQESGRSAREIDTTLLLSSSFRKPRKTPEAFLPLVFTSPPRLVADQLINIFFQEWAPLFPVLHRPTFLTLYSRYVADCESVTDKAEVAQLNLVFSIAALSHGARSSTDLESFERQWKAAVDSIISENSLATLQALILAQIFCVQSGDLTRLLTYKGLSSSLSARLGLHQSQKRFALGTLTCETRKKVFWTLYTVDCFTAVALGLPRQLKEDDINCEFPVDADDEYVTERGFQPTLPGESTKLSSALALFRACRILAKVLEEVYPAKTSYELSLTSLGELSEELDAWSSSLPPHLRLQFEQDKPSTGTISSRSPLLSLTYHYIRALIHRPAICASIGARPSSSSMIALATSCKHMIQIIQLLDERSLSFTCCLNRDEVLVLAGFGLLFQSLSLEPSSKILKDNSKMVKAAVQVLHKTKAPCVAEFERVATAFTPASEAPAVSKAKAAPLPRHNSDGGSSLQHSSLPSSTKQQLKAIASRFSSTGKSKTPDLDAGEASRRATLPTISRHSQSPATQSQPSLQPSPSVSSPVCCSEPPRSPMEMHRRAAYFTTNIRPSAPPPRLMPKSRLGPQKPPNLDYLSFGNDPERQKNSTATIQGSIETEAGPTDWERLLGNLDNGETNIFDACYGGPPIDVLKMPNLPVQAGTMEPLMNGSPNAWNADLWALCQTATNTSESTGPAGSILSLSTDEGHSSNEEFAAEWPGENGNGDRFVMIAQGDDYWQ